MRIPITPQLVADVLRVPRIEFPDYPSYKHLRTMSRDELMFAFCERPSAWSKRLFTPCRPFAKGPKFMNMVMTFVLHPLSLRFHDDDAHTAFSENFSRRGVHSERQVILADFANTDLLTVIHSQEWESLCDVSVTCPLVLIQEFYSNMHGIDRSVPLFFTHVRGTRRRCFMRKQ